MKSLALSLLVVVLVGCGDNLTVDGPTCSPCGEETPGCITILQPMCDAAYGRGVTEAFTCEADAPTVGPGYEDCYLTSGVMCCRVQQ